MDGAERSSDAGEDDRADRHTRVRTRDRTRVSDAAVRDLAESEAFARARAGGRQHGRGGDGRPVASGESQGTTFAATLPRD